MDNTSDTPFKTPDITPAQISAVVLAVIGVAAAFGLDISSAQRDALLQLAAIVPSVIAIGDAIIRHGRSKIAVAQIDAAALAADRVPPVPAPTMTDVKT